MEVFLGIDTGGTFTDAALYAPGVGVLSAAKAPTRHEDLPRSVREALQALDGPTLRTASLVGLSTTLATNAVVEGKRATVCLVLIGYPDDLVRSLSLQAVLAGDPVIRVAGGHDSSGFPLEDLDLHALEAGLAALGPGVEGYAVSSYFSVLNNDHEVRARALIRERTGKSCTCGHELTTRLNAERRAITTILNARLVPLIADLVDAVYGTLQDLGVGAPLMLVKGDGSLVSAEWARERPVETVLSGPAASVSGALELSGLQDALIVDMGGTTTDIALLQGGSVRLAPEGARVGDFRLMVETASIQTYALGGDSELIIDVDGALGFSERRAEPLCVLAEEDTRFLALLKSHLASATEGPDIGRFIIPGRSPSDLAALPAGRRALVEGSRKGPLALDSLFAGAESPTLLKRDLELLLDEGWIRIAAPTPTDATRLLNLHQRGSMEGAKLAMNALLARGLRVKNHQAKRLMAKTHDPALNLATLVKAETTLRSALLILRAILAETEAVEGEAWRALSGILRGELSGSRSEKVLSLTPRVNMPVVAIGAPALTYYPALEKLLGSRVLVPPRAEVANAVGAVAGKVVQFAEERIVPTQTGEGFTLLRSGGHIQFETLEAAVAAAQSAASEEALKRAQEAGAWEPGVTLSRVDLAAPNAFGTIITAEVTVRATATGRPRRSDASGAGPTYRG